MRIISTRVLRLNTAIHLLNQYPSQRHSFMIFQALVSQHATLYYLDFTPA